MRSDDMRSEVARLVRHHPFQPFAISMEDGDRIVIDHPEHIAFDPRTDGDENAPTDFYVITGSLRYYGSFEAVTSVAVRDTGEVARSHET